MLAEKAAKLPKVEFNFAGVEHYCSGVTNEALKDLPSTIEYIKKMKKRMWEQTQATQELIDAYNALRNVILEADIEDC